jgi:hypothetical protein
VSQVVDSFFYLICGVLAVRLALALLAANPTLVMPLVLAIGVYALCHAAITGIFRLVAHRKTEI